MALDVLGTLWGEQGRGKGAKKVLKVKFGKAQHPNLKQNNPKT